MKQKKKMTWAEWERAERPHMTLPNGDVLYEGDYGLTRDGRKVGPLTYKPPKYATFHCWDASPFTYGETGGGMSSGKAWEKDIIAKWVDQDTPKLWRDMTDAEKGALLLDMFNAGLVIDQKNVLG